MPVSHDYVCFSCEEVFEHTKPINDPDLETCPKCKERDPEKFYKLIGCPSFIFDKTPRTVGSFAEANTKKKGKSFIDEYNEYNKVRKAVAREALKRKLPKGASLVERKEGFIPWWRSGKVDGLPFREKPVDKKEAEKILRETPEIKGIIDENPTQNIDKLKAKNS